MKLIINKDRRREVFSDIFNFAFEYIADSHYAYMRVKRARNDDNLAEFFLLNEKFLKNKQILFLNIKIQIFILMKF